MGSANLFGQVLQDRNRDHDIEGLRRRGGKGQRCGEQTVANEDCPEPGAPIGDSAWARTVTLGPLVVNATTWVELESLVTMSSLLDPTG